MNPNYEHNEGRPPTQGDVQAILAKIRPASNSNPPVMGINIRRLMRAKANDFPRDMYHETLDPVVALNQDQIQDLLELGYRESYIKRSYPKMLFRRNMSEKFQLRKDPATKEPLNNEFVEERVVQTAEAEERLKKERRPSTCGPWFESLAELDALPDAKTVADVSAENERLKGQLAEARLAGEAKKKG